MTKAIIFSKKQVVKAFLEYADAKAAQRARQAYNDRAVESFGRAKIYFSALQELENNNKFLEYWDAREGKENVAPNTQESGRVTLKEAMKERARPGARDRITEFTPVRAPFRMLGDVHNAQSERKESTPETRSEFGETGVQLDFGRLAPRPSFLFGLERPVEVPAEQSCVILISNLDAEFGSARELFNLFSCFGFINKILMMKNLRKALVEYRTSA